MATKKTEEVAAEQNQEQQEVKEDGAGRTTAKTPAFVEELLKKVENYEKAKADNFVNWVQHHRLETHNSDGEKRLVQITAEELQALDMYYNRPAEELIWLTRAEHINIHREFISK